MALNVLLTALFTTGVSFLFITSEISPSVWLDNIVAIILLISGIVTVISTFWWIWS